jgi:hypothetical protein
MDVLFLGGNTVFDSSPEFNEKMKRAAMIMNTKGHLVGKQQKKMVYGAADIEG